jgi:2-oxoglutarate/2-oxoacid ferredoxin oxidoreductase subunit beta
MIDQDSNISNGSNKLSSKDFSTELEVRWCPGCGDFSILKQVQSILPEIGVPRENIVFISGIGCSSRFPYYMDTYGLHGIHGRATSIASGLKAVNPDLNIWIVTGDGDALSIGGNHLIHLLRRNFDLNILLFNNEIYGLTKGQYSPTSPQGSVSKSTPFGSVDHPFNPLALALGSEASFIARSMDRDTKHLRWVLKEANQHKGSSLVEIYQNCNVFNDGAFEQFTDKERKKESGIYLEEGKPLIFGQEGDLKAIILEDFKPKVVDINSREEIPENTWIHNPEKKLKAGILTQFFEEINPKMKFPRPFGIFYKNERTCYEELLHAQINSAIDTNGKGNLDELLMGNNSWTIK